MQSTRLAATATLGGQAPRARLKWTRVVLAKTIVMCSQPVRTQDQGRTPVLALWGTRLRTQASIAQTLTIVRLALMSRFIYRQQRAQLQPLA
jgi:hypothetical protein